MDWSADLLAEGGFLMFNVFRKRRPEQPKSLEAASRSDSGERLTEIPTDWKMIRQAFGETINTLNVEPVRLARESLWRRYEKASRRYIGGLVRDSQAAEEIYQDFAVKMFDGTYRNANPDKGKFRKYLKTCLTNLVNDHFNKLRRIPGALPEAMSDPADSQPTGPSDEADRLLLLDCRDVLLKASWRRLEAEEKLTGRPYMTALNLYVSHDGEGSIRLAERLSKILDKSITPAAFNKQIHIARKQHAFFLIDEVARTLDDDARLVDIEEELIALGLHEFQICRDALLDYRNLLQKRRRSGSSDYAEEKDRRSTVA